MNSREWALVAFTLLMQASVGIVLVVTAAQPAMGRLCSIVAALAGVAALVASLFHLGQPLQAWLAVGNVRSSWLSREIVSAVVFVAALFAWAALALLRPGSASTRAAAWIASGTGVVCILVMSRLYMTPAQPAWNRLATPTAFFATTLLAGIAVVLAIASRPGAEDSFAAVLRPLAAIGIALVVIQMALLVTDLNAIPREPAALVSSLSAANTWWLAAGRAVAAIGVALVLVRLFAAGSGPVSGVVLVALVIASELIGRILFYSSSVRLGLR